MPARERERISLDTLEAKRLIGALRIAAEAMRKQADDPSVPEDDAIECEQAYIAYDALGDELERLHAEAYREASERFNDEQGGAR